MKPFLYLLVVEMVVQSAISSQIFAENPTIQTLVGNVPVLSPDNERLDRFQFTFESIMFYQVRTTYTVSWSRQDQLGMLATAGEDAIPFWFVSQKQVMMFDTTDGTALVGKGGARFIVRSDGTKLNTGDPKSEVALDLPSLLDQATNNGELKQTASGEWSLATVSRSGKSKMVALFENSPPFQIRRLEMRPVMDDSGDSALFVARDITLNSEPAKSLPRFPLIAEFPHSLKVTRAAELNESFFGKLSAAGIGGRSLLAQIALRHTKLRDYPLVAHVDWDNAERINDEIGPQLARTSTTGTIML